MKTNPVSLLLGQINTIFLAYRGLTVDEGILHTPS